MQTENVSVNSLINQVLEGNHWIKEWYQGGIVGFDNGNSPWSGEGSNPYLNHPQARILKLGCGGFDAKGQVHWVGMDLDVNKGSNNDKYATIEDAIKAAREIRQFVGNAAEVRHSTSGNGIHLRIKLPGNVTGGKATAQSIAKYLADTCKVRCDRTALGTQLFYFWTATPAESSYKVIESCDGTWTPPPESLNYTCNIQPAKGIAEVSSDTLERASKYIMKMGPCVAGQGGDNHLYKVAVALIRGFGLPFDAALGLFREYNKSCQPPWNEERLLYKLYEADKLTGTTGYLLDSKHLRIEQVANAFLHASGYGDLDNSTLRYWHGQFYTYNGFCYRELLTDDLNAQVVRFLREIERMPDSISAFLCNITKTLQTLLNIDSTVKPGSFISSRIENNNIISVNNGLLDIKSHELSAHTPDYFTLTSLPFEYNKNAKCDKWLAFLDQVQPEEASRKIIQEWYGLNLVYDSTFEKFMLFVGEGSNGKSVATDVLKYLIGEGNYSCLSLEQFDSSRTFPLAATEGKLSNICPDLRKISDFDEGMLKKYVTGEKITVEHKNKNPFDMLPTARLTFSCNQKPLIQDKTNGVWRRLLAICFKQTFTGESINRALKTKQYWIDELPGILNWALEGLERLRNSKVGFTQSAISDDFIQEYRKDCNYTLVFLQECIAHKTDNFVTRNDLFYIYQEYMKTYGYKPLGQKNFYQELRKEFKQVDEVKYNGYRGFKNIELSGDALDIIGQRQNRGQQGQNRDSKGYLPALHNPFKNNN